MCPCAEFGEADLRRLIADDPGLSFDELLARTGAGAKCTACLLDLEYYYTILPRDGLRPAAEAKPETRARESISLKQRVYRLIDRLSPPTPMLLREYMPVLCGSALEQWVCVANHSMLYEPGACAPNIDVKLVVRDAGGKELHRETAAVVSGSSQRILVSSRLPVPRDGELGIGSVSVSRRSRQPGIRGTTRPQVEIVSPAGSCAVHTQAPGRLRNRWLSLYHRPGEERLFATAVNASAAPLQVEIAYPFARGDAGAVVPAVQQLSVPPFGARLHEFVLAESVSRALNGKLFDVRFSTGGLGKLHLLCATPNLDRFSIDHL